MAFDFSQLVDKIGADLLKSNDLSKKSITTANGTSIVNRDLTDIATGLNIARNQAALAQRDTEGIAIRVEMDYD